MSTRGTWQMILIRSPARSARGCMVLVVGATPCVLQMVAFATSPCASWHAYKGSQMSTGSTLSGATRCLSLGTRAHLLLLLRGFVSCDSLPHAGTLPPRPCLRFSRLRVDAPLSAAGAQRSTQYLQRFHRHLRLRRVRLSHTLVSGTDLGLSLSWTRSSSQRSKRPCQCKWFMFGVTTRGTVSFSLQSPH